MVKEHSNSWYIYESYPQTPISTTHESLKNGIEMRTKIRFISRKQLNFHSYPMDEANFRFTMQGYDDSAIPEIPTSYNRDYQQPYPSKCKPREVIKDMPADDFNRKPVNDLLMIPHVETKFMDDSLTNTSEARRRINFFRQLRNKSFKFGE